MLYVGTIIQTKQVLDAWKHSNIKTLTTQLGGRHHQQCDRLVGQSSGRAQSDQQTAQ